MKVTSTQKLVARAIELWPTASAPWPGAIQPNEMVLKKVPSIYKEACKPIKVCDFSRILELARVMGLDGSGGALNASPNLRAVGAGVSVINFGRQEGQLIEKATPKCNVPVRQSVGRGETRSLHCGLCEWT